LQSIIDINREIKQRKWKSRVVNEVHDSLISEVAEDELDEYISVSRDVMTHRLREKWKWIAMDLKTETEYSPDSWHDKKAYNK
jgi:DNA polymerase I-like protein with 3'-5' exonuclease and polymerase domains